MITTRDFYFQERVLLSAYFPGISPTKFTDSNSVLFGILNPAWINIFSAVISLSAKLLLHEILLYLLSTLFPDILQSVGRRIKVPTDCNSTAN